MKQCPFCAEEIRDEAVKCRHCGSMLEGSALSRTWHRSRHGKMLAGVCAGLAKQFGISVTALRLAVVLLALIGVGWGIIIYIVLWVIMPYEPESQLSTASHPQLTIRPHATLSPPTDPVRQPSRRHDPEL